MWLQKCICIFLYVYQINGQESFTESYKKTALAICNTCIQELNLKITVCDGGPGTIMLLQIVLVSVSVIRAIDMSTTTVAAVSVV